MPNLVKEFEQETDNTYGIEIEFGTHDSQILSFTHIEVCSFGEKDIPETRWKIETDADYTLELVSPILFFTAPETARQYRNELMALLDTLVSEGISLEDLINILTNHILVHFSYSEEKNIVEYRDIAQEIESEIIYIKSGELYQALDWHNWDEDTNLSAVLSAREYFIGGKQTTPFGNDRVEGLMKNIFISSSAKHGGLPSSQLNVPHQLSTYINYMTLKKNQKSWDRLVEEDTDTDEYKAKKIEELLERYPRLKEDEVWMAKYGHLDYIDMLVEEKTPIWHRYWLWENVLEICSMFLTVKKWDISPEDLNTYPTFSSIRDFLASTELNEGKLKRKLIDMEIDLLDYYNQNVKQQMYFNITYLALHKIISGAFSTLSEAKQGYAQRLLFKFEGEVGMDTITAGIAESEFLQFHFALKDLTSLWFKAPLVDTIETQLEYYQNTDTGKKTEINQALEDIKNCDPNIIADLFESVLSNCLDLLGRYVGLRKEDNTGYDYDWDDFKSYNMPSVLATTRRFRQVLSQFQMYQKGQLKEGVNIVASLMAKIPEGYTPPQFLGRYYVNAHTETKIPIASWEGRWDTMKKPIRTKDQPPRYLIEHRNN